MAEILLITANDVKELTALAGNLDSDKFVQWIKVAQDIHIERVLGTKLLSKIKADIQADTLTGYYQTLVGYIKPCLIHYTLVEYLPFAAYSITNGGVYKRTADNSINAEKNEIDFLNSKSQSNAEHYKQRLLDYICANSSHFPEYNQNTNGDIYPDSDNYNVGWVIE